MIHVSSEKRSTERRAPFALPCHVSGDGGGDMKVVEKDFFIRPRLKLITERHDGHEWACSREGNVP